MQKTAAAVRKIFDFVAIRSPHTKMAGNKNVLFFNLARLTASVNRKNVNFLCPYHIVSTSFFYFNMVKW